MAFNLLDSKSGRPSVNQKDDNGNVRVSIALPSVKGNITRTFTLVGTKVSTVSATFKRELTKSLTVKKTVKKSVKKVAAPAVA